MPDPLSAADFVSALGAPFPLAGVEPELALELIEVTAAPPRDSADAARRAAAGIRIEPFILVFRGPRDRTLAQGTRALVHPALGELEIFLVPLQPDALGPRYEAVFN